MAKYFDPRYVLRQMAKPLLREFFRRRNELLDLPWDELKDAKDIEPIYAAWQRLPDDSRWQVQVIFRDLALLSDHRGLRAFAGEIQARAPHLAWQFAACRSNLNKALWFYLNFPDAFGQASLFARADALSTGRYAVRRNGLPKRPMIVTPALIELLQKSLQEHYWPNEMRGQSCRISHYSRPGGSEYFFAYLDDWPDMPLVFTDNGDLIPKIERYAFYVVFVACPADGSLELIARGGPNVQYSLQRRFCQVVYGLDIEPADPLRPEYRLQHVLDPDFTYPTHPPDCIERVRLCRILLGAPDHELCVDGFQIFFKQDAWRGQWLETINNSLQSIHLSASETLVQEVTYQLFFKPAGCAPHTTMTFGLALPGWCDLKSKPDELRIIGERCIQLWEMISA